MNWAGIQVERVRFFAIYKSLPFAILRLLATLTFVCCLLVFTGALFNLGSSTLTGFALILLGPVLAIGAFHIYVLSVWTSPTFGHSPKTDTPLDRFDYETLGALLAYRKSGNRADFWKELARLSVMEAFIFRLGLTARSLRDIYPQPDQGVETFIQAILDQHPNNVRIDVFDAAKTACADPAITKFLKRSKLSLESVGNLLDYYAWRYKQARERRFWDSWKRGNGGFAKLWSTSYTTLLDRFTQDLGPSLITRHMVAPLVGRSESVEELILELNKRAGQNVLLVGEIGVGRTEVFYELASRILSYQTKTRLDGLQVRILDLPALFAAAPNPADQPPLFEALFADIVRAENVLLFIPRFDLLLTGQGAGSTDVGTLLSQYLGDGRIHVIGTVTPESQITMVRSHPALAENFSLVKIESPTTDDLQRVMLINLPMVEYRYHVFFLLTAVDSIIQLAGRYLKNESSPAREIRLMEEVAAHGQKNGTIITPSEVEQVVERRANVQLQVDETEQNTLLNLETELHRRVVGQDRAIKLVSDALLRARAGLAKETKPIGTFLFLGPTGVGKTETAKALAEIYFGTSKNLIRLDMSEYADQTGLEKLLGTDPVRQPGSLTVAIQKTPSAVVLFDEVEKANETVRNLMLQLLDEGHLTTNYGKVLDFTNSIVIATSNAGSDFIKVQVERGTAPSVLEKQLLDQLIAQHIYPPEYLNRFDGVVVYLPLTKAEIKQVVGLQLKALVELVKREKGIEVTITDGVVATLADRGYDPVFGARALQRVIKDELETAIARQLITQKPEPGSRLTIDSL